MSLTLDYHNPGFGVVCTDARGAEDALTKNGAASKVIRRELRRSNAI